MARRKTTDGNPAERSRDESDADTFYALYVYNDGRDNPTLSITECDSSFPGAVETREELRKLTDLIGLPVVDE